MKINNPAQIVSIGGILTTLAVLFQSLPVFLPGMGLIISPLATLPIALAAVGSTNLGVILLFSSTLILLLISPQEAVIFLFATGLLGLTLGASYNKRIPQSIATATITLFTGINILIHIVGIIVVQLSRHIHQGRYNCLIMQPWLSTFLYSIYHKPNPLRTKVRKVK